MRIVSPSISQTLSNTQHPKQTDTLTEQHKTYNITLTTSQVQDTIKHCKNNNSQGPDKLNIRHLKHIGPLGLAFLTSMFKTALNKNIIPHTWKLANIVPIPKPNKDTDKGTSYRPISLLSVIAKTLKKSIIPYITANIPNTPTQHGYEIQHSTMTALHTRWRPVTHTIQHLYCRHTTIQSTCSGHGLCQDQLELHRPGVRFAKLELSGH